MQQHIDFANHLVSLKSSVKTSDIMSPIWSQPLDLHHTFYSNKLPEMKLYSPSPLNPFLIYYTNPNFILGERKACYTDVMTPSMISDANLHCSLNCLVGTSYSNLSEAAKRKVSTRESSATLKAWLNDHRKNPYPTKSEKVMLSVITKMTLTQVSTWFANARRRLKKETKNSGKTFLGSQEAYQTWLSSKVKDLENISNNLDDSVDIDVFNCSSTEIINLEKSSSSIQFSNIQCDDYVTSSVDICCQQSRNSDNMKMSNISDCVDSAKDQEFQSLVMKSPSLLSQPPPQSSSSSSLIECFNGRQSSLSVPLKSSSEVVTMLPSQNCSSRIEPLEECKKNKIWSIDDLISSGNSKVDLESEHEAEVWRSSNFSDNK